LAPPINPPIAYAAADVAGGKSFEDIFKSAQIPDSPFPAERLLRLLDGLRAMDEATRKAAVHAMDAADDNWTIDDSIIDAQRKIAALEDYQKALESQLTANQQQVIAEVADLKAAEERAVTEIRKQIAEMERLLAREIQKTAEQITNLEGGQKAAQENCEREVKRLQAEVERLREIPAQFSH
jgi:DNA repair exonuclease SbcCD ATPase subunit